MSEVIRIDVLPYIFLHALHKLMGFMFIDASKLVDEYHQIVLEPFHVLYMVKVLVVHVFLIEFIDFTHYKKPVPQVGCLGCCLGD